MRLIKYLYLFTILLVTLAACSDPENPIIDEDLLDVVWRVDTLQTPEEEIVPGPDTLMTLRFLQDTRIDAITPCNDYTGTYSINKHRSLAIEWHSWTEMACMGRPGILEGRFIKALNSVFVYDVSDRRLTIYDRDRHYVVKLNQE